MFERKSQGPLPPSSFVGVGICFGVAIGAGLGVAFGNLALGIGIGVALGALAGVVLSKRLHR